jgi:Mg2+ and Co2+ transporter CorA
VRLPSRIYVTSYDVERVEEREIARHFGLHPLALETAVNVPPRAKSELYELGYFRRRRWI